MATTFQHSKARQVAVGGFSNKVPLPSNPASNVFALYHSAHHSAVIPISFSTLAYTTVLPLGALVLTAKVILTTPFSDGSTIEVGNSPGNGAILAPIFLSVQSTNLTISPFVASADLQTVFITIAGVPTAGAGFLLLEYINPEVSFD